MSIKWKLWLGATILDMGTLDVASEREAISAVLDGRVKLSKPIDPSKSYKIEAGKSAMSAYGDEFADCAEAAADGSNFDELEKSAKGHLFEDAVAAIGKDPQVEIKYMEPEGTFGEPCPVKITDYVHVADENMRVRDDLSDSPCDCDDCMSLPTSLRAAPTRCQCDACLEDARVRALGPTVGIDVEIVRTIGGQTHYFDRRTGKELDEANALKEIKSKYRSVATHPDMPDYSLARRPGPIGIVGDHYTPWGDPRSRPHEDVQEALRKFEEEYLMTKEIRHRLAEEALRIIMEKKPYDSLAD